MDYPLFCLAALLLFAALQVWAWRGNHNRRLLLWAGAACLSLLAGGWFVVRTAGERAQANVAELLRDYAYSIGRPYTKCECLCH